MSNEQQRQQKQFERRISRWKNRYEERKQPRERGENLKAKEGELKKSAAKSQQQQQSCGSPKDYVCGKPTNKAYMSNEQRQQQQHEPNRTHSPLVSSTIIRKEWNDGYEEGKQARDRGEHLKAKEGESEKNVAKSQQQTCGSSKDDLCRKEKIKEYNSNKQQQQQIQHGPHRTHSPMVSSKKNAQGRER